MRVVTVTPLDEVDEPLNFDMVKTELRIDSDELDEHVRFLIAAARSFFEEQTGYALVSRTLCAYLRFWPKATNVLLPYPPLRSVTSVTCYPLGNATPFTDFLVDNKARQGSILLLPGASWPTGVLYPPGIAIEYVAGYGDYDTDVPPDIRECLMQLISFWDETPEAVYVPGTNRTAGKTEVMPMGAKEIIDRYRKLRDR